MSVQVLGCASVRRVRGRDQGGQEGQAGTSYIPRPLGKSCPAKGMMAEAGLAGLCNGWGNVIWEGVEEGGCVSAGLIIPRDELGTDL